MGSNDPKWLELYEKYRTFNWGPAEPVDLSAMGAAAYDDGKLPEDNPLTDSADRQVWYRGWCEAQRTHWGL